MSDVFRKLNLKDQREIVVLNSPASFEPEMQGLGEVAIRRSIDDSSAVAFSLAFVTKQDEVDRLAAAIAAKASGDCVVWFAYPKGSSRNYKSEINRDSGWKVLGDCGFEPVRMIAIDADWSAVRFRRAEFIKTLTRGVEWTQSAVGREKAAAQAKARKKPAANKAKKSVAKKAAGKARARKTASASTAPAKKASARKAPARKN
jgi:hypothetical protein